MSAKNKFTSEQIVLNKLLELKVITKKSLMELAKVKQPAISLWLSGHRCISKPKVKLITEGLNLPKGIFLFSHEEINEFFTTFQTPN